MSFPQFQYEKSRGKNYFIFTVPDHRVVDKIARDRNHDETLRVKALAKSLSENIDDLRNLLLHYRHGLEATATDDRFELKLKLEKRPNAYENFTLRRKNIGAFGQENIQERRYANRFHGADNFPRLLPSLPTVCEDEEVDFSYGS